MLPGMFDMCLQVMVGPISNDDDNDGKDDDYNDDVDVD